MFKIRSLLDALGEMDADAINRLSDLRGLGGRGRDAKCKSLARSYGGDHSLFIDDLRKADLVALLGNPLDFDEGEYYLPSASMYSKDDLTKFALKAFRDGVVPSEFVQAEDDDEEVEDVDGDELEPEGSEDEDEGDDEDEDDDDEIDHAGAEYEEEFRRELTYSREDADRPLYEYQRRAVEAVLASLEPIQPKILHLATGGGKTRVANTIVDRWRSSHRGSVLWVTKDWRLLKQAAMDFSKRYSGAKLTRLGGDGHVLHPLPEGTAGTVVYTTVQTLTRRLPNESLAGVRPSLLVWDECHWGEHAGAGKILTVCKRTGVPVLGLTATPRDKSRSRYSIAYSKTFKELVDEGYLAQHVVQQPVRTGVRWTPAFRGRLDDVTRASLNELACSDRRNTAIVGHYVKNVGRYGKTIVFACNIDHVNRLATLFTRAGIAARGIHSERPGEVPRAIEKFKSGAVQLLVNVEMLTHGFNVPDAKTVFLCRPTTSDILFAQMVGRAARRDDASGKTSFFVVEFTDNVTEHGELFKTSKQYFTGACLLGEAPSSVRVRSAPCRPLREHAFDPAGKPTWIPNGDDRPESVRGLWFRQGQTFGIEFELTPEEGPIPELGPAWASIAERLRTRLTAALPDRVADHVINCYAGQGGSKDVSVWNVEYDSSAGWEVTTRVLKNEDGFLEVDAACKVLGAAAAELGLRVSHRTGTHIHVGWVSHDIAEIKRLLALVRLFEPALASLVAPSRVVRWEGGRYHMSQPNAFCRPVSNVFSSRVIGGLRSWEDLQRVTAVDGARYVTLNLSPLPTLHTVEVRQHNGTLEARKILLWVSLWQQLLWAASNGVEVPAVADAMVLEPTADIVQLASKYLPDARQPQQRVLLRLLAARRSEIREDQWKLAPDLAPWVAATTDWVNPA